MRDDFSCSQFGVSRHYIWEPPSAVADLNLVYFHLHRGDLSHIQQYECLSGESIGDSH